MSELLEEGHWKHEDYWQRITSAQWKKMLLANQDTIIFRGVVRRLKARSIGFGVVEIYKGDPLHKAKEEDKNKRIN